MIAVQNLSLQFGGQVLFEDISFTLRENDRVGLVGKNGAGKSTLLKIISGIQKADAGNIIIPKGNLTGFLTQDLNPLFGKTVFEEAESAFSEALELDQLMHDLQHALETRTDYESKEYHDIIDQMHEASHRLEILNVASIDKQIELVLSGLGFLREEFSKRVELFSGGWQMRIELAKILLRKPELILLDEPTNHLDIESIQWLEEYLKTYPGAIILVSHDRTFLDKVSNRTIEIVNSKIYDYPASYSKFVELRKERIDQQKSTQKNQEKYIEHTEQLIDKFRAKANKAKFAQSLIKKLDKLEEIEVDDEESAAIQFHFPQPPRSGKTIVQTHHLIKNYDDKNVLNDINILIERGDKIAFVGKNGEGKSTMSKVIAGIEKYDGELIIGHNVSLGYYAQNQADTLNTDDTVFDIIDHAAVGEIRTKIRNLLGAFLFSGDNVYKKVKVLSGGEKSRLALCKLLLEPKNLLILDEPTNHLDMSSKDVLKNALQKFEGTVIVVSHDRDFLKGLTNRVFEFKDKNVKEYVGDIYDYLEAKKISDLTQLEVKEKNTKQAKVSAEQKDIYGEKRNKDRELNRIKKEIEKTEVDISTMEKQIALIEIQLKDPDFFSKNKNNTDIFKTYDTLKAAHINKMEAWEQLQIQLEEKNAV